MRYNKDYKVLLSIPPDYDTQYPPLGTPMLTAFLKSKGIDARQLDLNMMHMDYRERQRGPLKIDYARKLDSARPVYYKRFLKQYDKEDWWSYRFQWRSLVSSYDFAEALLSSRMAARFIKDERENLFYDFFGDVLYPIIKKGSFNMAGFSITAPSQAVSSLTFGYLAKKHFPRMKVVIGGQWVSLYRDAIIARKDLAQFFDFMITFEGETPLFRLINALLAGKDPAGVPNLAYKKNGSFVFSAVSSEEDLNDLPAPDFDGLDLKRYEKSRDEKALYATYETSRGCYWGRCAFCVSHPLPKQRYREKDPRIIADDIALMIRRYGIKRLAISNAVLSPGQMRAMSQALLKRRIKISWKCFAYFDERFDGDTFALAKRAGCTTVVFGLESASQRLLDFIRKGTDLSTVKRIARLAEEAGLDMVFEVILGLPSETRAEALDTMLFLKRLPARVSWSYSKYILTPGTRVFNRPASFGVRLKSRQAAPFKFFHEFKHKGADVGPVIARMLARRNLTEAIALTAIGLK